MTVKTAAPLAVANEVWLTSGTEMRTGLARRPHSIATLLWCPAAIGRGPTRSGGGARWVVLPPVR
jgi:hypothetical protein